MIQTIKHNGGNIMLWKCILYQDVGNLPFIDTNIDRFQHSSILADNLEGFARNMSLDECF
ncbi:hypothetical protein CWI37_0658p0010 [Hamiltosporidium tvaerminnensis]|uniref:Uncharacterized protein n=1 Tax=Hamiltosporidium tvaerminnensis TaxID=1176355 RepID=A0A4Q9L3C8_9MICR|nr:hypothetical protein CWI37_0658p0010 [Hamiltosporidium tvaerminnensis]